MKQRYLDYLNSYEWKEKSRHIKHIFNNRCWFCGSTKNLNVHHTKYFKCTFKHFKLRWFLCVCNDCHKKIHQIQKLEHLEVYKATKTYRNRFFPYKQMHISPKYKNKEPYT